MHREIPSIDGPVPSLDVPEGRALMGGTGRRFAIFADEDVLDGDGPHEATTGDTMRSDVTMGGAISGQVREGGTEYEKRRDGARDFMGGAGGRYELPENEDMDDADGGVREEGRRCGERRQRCWQE